MIASKTFYHNATRTKVVEEGDKDAQFLIVREGQEISDALAEKYGLDKKSKKDGDEEKKDEDDAPEKKSKK